MALLAEPGVLDAGHDLTHGTAVSQNVIDLGALAINGFGPGRNDLFLDIETEIAEGASSGSTSTYTVNLVLDDSNDLGSIVYKVLSIVMGQNDPRIDVVGRKIYTGAIPDQVWQLARLGYRYFGLQYVLANGDGTAAVSVNAALSPSKPRTLDNTQVIRSNVNLPA